MNTDSKIYLLGSGWLSASGFGTFEKRPEFPAEDVSFKYPDLHLYIEELPSRYGRFDIYTKVAFSTAVLALSDASRLKRDQKKNIGIVVGSSSGVIDNDLAYFESTIEAQGAFTSPNLFSYTLPNVALGEIAVFFKYTGPSFCVGNDPQNPGVSALSAACSLLTSKQCDYILVGWVEVTRKVRDRLHCPKGASFALLTLDKSEETKAEFSMDHDFRFSELFQSKLI